MNKHIDRNRADRAPSATEAGQAGTKSYRAPTVIQGPRLSAVTADSKISIK